jgi:histidine triad (HIT) family protein
MDADCIFCKIIEGSLPAFKVFEDNDVVAFLDIFPVQPGHVLVIPKKHSKDIFDTPDVDMQKVIAAAKKLSWLVKEATKADGINIGMNNGSASGQVVMHAHVHVIPRFDKDGLNTWPQRPYKNDEEKIKMAEKIRTAASTSGKKGEIALSKTLLTAILCLAAAVVLFLIFKKVLCSSGIWNGVIC